MTLLDELKNIIGRVVSLYGGYLYSITDAPKRKAFIDSEKISLYQSGMVPCEV